MHLAVDKKLKLTSIIGAPQRVRSEHRISISSIIVLTLIAICVPASIAHSQTIDLSVDGRLGTGATIASTNNETSWARAPTNLQVDVGFVMDGDEQFEWALGTIVQLETQVAVALNPKLKLMREFGATKAYASIGLPWFVTPIRRLGVELGGGLIAAVSDNFSWVGGVTVQAYFAGADVPDGQTVLVLNGTFGARIAF